MDFWNSETFNPAVTYFFHLPVRDAVTAACFNVSNEQDDAFLSYNLGLIVICDDENMPDIVFCIQSELAEDE